MYLAFIIYVIIHLIIAMKLTTNIVLVGDQGPTQSYMIQLTPDVSDGDEFSFIQDVPYELFDKNSRAKISCVLPYDEINENKWIKNENEWYLKNINGQKITTKSANIRLYFPQYSVDTFSNGSVYMLSLFTYIHGAQIELGNFEFKRSDSLACTPIKFGGMDEYYEYIDFKIIDPFSLHYSNNTTPVRDALGEPRQTNNTGSILYACLYIVEKRDDIYFKKDGWTEGQNSILISDPDDLSAHLKYNVSNRTLDLNLTFNSIYESNLIQYIKETYNCPEFVLYTEYVVMDKDNIYYQYNSGAYSTKHGSFDDSFDDSFEKTSIGILYHMDIDKLFCIPTPTDPSEDPSKYFKTFDDWREGLYIVGSVSIMSESEYLQGGDIPFITIFSNKLPLTPDLFSMMLSHGDFPTKINTDIIDMNDVTIKTVNIITTESAPSTPVRNSSKSHIIQPVFYQTRDIGNVIIHPAVSENIAVNLETYKPYVKRFMLQIEGVSFNEIGRNSQGVIFKISGNMLPKESDSGVLYVLNENADLVTTGKYIYSF